MKNHKFTDIDLFANIPNKENFTNPVVTIGSFDGVHRGHKKIIQKLLERSTERKGDSIVLTFETHPRTFLNPEIALKIITTNEEKADLLRAEGVDHILMLRFSREMADLHALDFYNQLLIGKLGIKDIIIGYDHVFGKNKEGGIELLQKLGKRTGIGVYQVEEVLEGGRAISSTWIRDEISKGNIGKANAMLGWNYYITGYVVHGEGRGRMLGFPTANVQPNSDNKIIPADGVYAVTVSIEGVAEKRGMLNVGTNPTFDGKRRTIEVNIFDFDADLYGTEITVNFCERIRDERKFNGIEELKKQLNADRQKVIELIPRSACADSSL